MATLQSPPLVLDAPADSKGSKPVSAAKPRPLRQPLVSPVSPYGFVHTAKPA